jgi:hypothetical protein
LNIVTLGAHAVKLEGVAEMTGQDCLMVADRSSDLLLYSLIALPFQASPLPSQSEIREN